ncbi:tRNA (adenosine(37)-N6)-dimethylallyltransferase MiaA [Cumulibacter manganitolerans]|uniref:tRNA (adenosine(37)-N6)-dimethylallyltransferase MiaA n=1 Tax=Cumulibacter manganitolerans TaxID=1884992 RepID=UPI001E4EEFB1|nr:tRNA (adenosine(37)-N6)-dimethylallyltransferase MiaA [Cumulibacter manganitolerans]
MSRTIVVLGPTASGKTSLALDIAERLGGPDAAEIVNADSMQVYRGMDIGTAKVPPADRRGIAHHLFDVWPVEHAVTVAEYRELARATVAEIQARGKHALLVGGSGLYITATIDDLRFPGTDPLVRARLESELAAEGAIALHRRLRAVDPVAAERILPTNGRRIVRALEVVEITGAPFTASLPTAAAPVLEAVQLGLDRPADELARRIETRVDLMWRDGLVDEVRGLRPGIEQGRTASRALGYAQVLRFLRGEVSEQQARDDTVTATRRFARRQRSWFARDRRIHWLDAASGGLLDAALRTIDG